MRFRDALPGSGIAYRHTDGASGRRYVVEPMTAGLALLDYDGDGFTDIYFANGTPLPGNPAEGDGGNALYRNNGDWTFTDVTHSAFADDGEYGLGVVAGDYDNDGDPDLYVSNYGKNTLLANNGDGTFTDITLFSETAGDQRFSAGASFLDMDGDGDLDLYVANYQNFHFDQHIVRKIGGYQFHPGPHDYPPEPDNLFRNNGDGTFLDVSETSGIASVASTGMGVASFDVDDDGDYDVLVANDSRPNFVFLNDGHGNFSESALLSGLAYDRASRANGNMGIEVGDVDRDGQLDVVTTTYQDEMPVLYRNLGSGLFDDLTNRSGIDRSLLAHVNWGVGLVDFDNDMDLDLFIACGHFMDNIRFIDDRTGMKVANYLLANDGKGYFSNHTAGSGLDTQASESSRGAAFDDLDNDGRIDVIVQNFNSPPSLFQNVSPAGQSLAIRLVGTDSNRDAAGAMVHVTSEGRMQSQAVLLGRGYQSHYGQILHFGIAKAVIDQVDVHWPSGKTSRIRKPNSDQVLTVIEP